MNTLYRISHTVLKNYANLMLKMDVQQAVPMPEGAKIITPNHPTTVDPLLVLTLMTTPTHVLITESAFKVPLIGSFLRQCGHIPVEAENGGKAFDAALHLLEAGCTVAIFPEGALSPAQGGMYPARTGAVRLALMAQAPIVPVGIAVKPENIYKRRMVIEGVEQNARWYLHGPYAMTVGTALHLAGDVNNWEQVRMLSQRLTQVISRLAQRSEARLMKPTLTLRDTAEVPTI